MDKNKDKKISRDEFPGPPQFFDRIDENHDGFIDEAEYKKFRERIANGGSQRLSEMMLKYLDTDHDGKISRAEFTAIMQIFDSLDKDHDGFLSQEELGRFFQVLNDVKVASTGGVEVDNLFAKFDKNKDGKITPDEMNNERTFKALDLNNDGQITREEAEQALKQLAERSRQKQQAEKK
jgi:Ca2+-binding EF-hand superfamily protein